MIVSGQRGAKFDDLPRRKPFKLLPLDALNKGLYAAAICKDRDQLWSAEVAAKLAVSFSAAELAHLAKSQDFDANMISASQGEGIDRLRILVRSAKSKGSRPKVPVGGGTMEHCGYLVVAIGTDYVAPDVREALSFCALNGIFN